jgi:HEAT repeat protein
LMMNGSEAAAAILLKALQASTGRAKTTLVGELVSTRDGRAGPVFAYLLRHVDRRTLLPVYAAAIEALGHMPGTGTVDALTYALNQGDWWAPMRTRRLRAAAAASLRRVGTEAAIDALRQASTGGRTRGVRAAARAEIERI